MEQNLHRVCSQPSVNSWHLGSISHYIDDVLSINHPEFGNYLGQMYPVELEIKHTTESNTSASYLDILLSIGRDGQFHTSVYDKRDNFNFHITKDYATVGGILATRLVEKARLQNKAHMIP